MRLARVWEKALWIYGPTDGRMDVNATRAKNAEVSKEKEEEEEEKEE